jgi:UDP-glucuronate 4-epimerase
MIHKFTKLIDEGNPILINGDGTISRDFTYIDNIVKGIECALFHLNGYNIFNLGESNMVTINEVIKIIEEILEKKATIQYGIKLRQDVKITLADISKAKKEIGYRPESNLINGLNNFISWYQKNKNFF